MRATETIVATASATSARPQAARRRAVAEHLSAVNTTLGARPEQGRRRRAQRAPAWAPPWLSLRGGGGRLQGERSRRRNSRPRPFASCEPRGPVEHRGGGRSVYLRDPAGNLVEVRDFFERDQGARDGVNPFASE